MPRPERAIKGFPGCRTAYPELRALGYASVPDFRERTPWGSSKPGQYREAGLPNITGSLRCDFDNYRYSSGVITPYYSSTVGYKRTQSGIMGQGFDLDASISSPVYGRSSTVQPAAYTVRYLIRARN